MYSKDVISYYLIITNNISKIVVIDFDIKCGCELILINIYIEFYINCIYNVRT